MADLEQSLEELEAVKQSFKANINNTGISTSSVEFRNMPNLINQMEKKLPVQTKSVNPTTSSQSITADAGYKLTKVEVGAVNPSDYYKPEEVANVTPTTDAQSITPTAGAVFNQVNVSAVTSAIDANIKAENIKSGTTILGVTGTLEEGGGEIQGYNVESIISEDGLTQTLKITTGTGEGTVGGDLIDVDELPTENVEDNKIYRVINTGGEYYYIMRGETLMSLKGGYQEIFVDNIDNVSDPILTVDETMMYVYTDTRTYIGYVFYGSAENRFTLAELFGLSADRNGGLIDDILSAPDAGVYYVRNASATIGVPATTTNKDVMAYVGGEWKKYSTLTNDMVTGVWYREDQDEYLELKADGTFFTKSSSGEVTDSGYYDIFYRREFGSNFICLHWESMPLYNLYEYRVEGDTIMLGDYYVKQSELVVPAVGGLPIDITTDAEMTNALTEANVGKVYKFTGTSDTYETDAIYIISEV